MKGPDSTCAGREQGGKYAFICMTLMKVEITHNVPGTASEPPDYSTGRSIGGARSAVLAVQAVIHCLAVRGFGGTPGGPRCQFRLGNDSVALPMSLLLADIITRGQSEFL